MSNFSNIVAAVATLFLVSCADVPTKKSIGETLGSPFLHEEGLPFTISIPNPGSKLSILNTPYETVLIDAGDQFEIRVAPIWFDGASNAIKRIVIPIRELLNNNTSIVHSLVIMLQDKAVKPYIDVLSDQVSPKSVILINKKEGVFEIKAINTSKVSIPIVITEEDADLVSLSSDGNWIDVEIEHIKEYTYLLNFDLPNVSDVFTFNFTASDHDGASTTMFTYKPLILPAIKIIDINNRTFKSGTTSIFHYDKKFDGTPSTFSIRMVDSNKNNFGNKVWGDISINQQSESVSIRIDSVSTVSITGYIEVVVIKEGVKFIDYYAVNFAK